MSIINYSTRNGFITIPRTLLINALKEQNQKLSPSLSLIAMLVHFNYADNRSCRRGECRYSIKEWSAILQASTSSIQRLFNRLMEEGELEISNDNPRTYRLTRYEELCGFKKQETRCGKRKALKPENDENFIEFFNNYNGMAGRTKFDINETYKAWKTLTQEENIWR